MKVPIPIFRPSAGQPGERRNGFERLAGLLGPKSPSGDRAALPIEQAIAAAGLQEMEARYDAVQGLVLCGFTAAKRPTLTPHLLDDVARIQDAVAASHEANDGQGVRYLGFASQVPGVWNSGSDFDLLGRLIRAQDRDALLSYALAVVGIGHRNYTALDLPLVTISLVQGDALGSGFETALSSNVIIAERSARFASPEILFNLFPGLGAYSYLARRIAPGLAERMILSGRVYGAAELHEAGIVDVLCEDGGGMEALYAFMSRGEPFHRVQRNANAARRRVNPLAKDELDEIATGWVDAALGLSEQNLRLIKRMSVAQTPREP